MLVEKHGDILHVLATEFLMDRHLEQMSPEEGYFGEGLLGNVRMPLGPEVDGLNPVFEKPRLDAWLVRNKDWKGERACPLREFADSDLDRRIEGRKECSEVVAPPSDEKSGVKSVEEKARNRSDAQIKRREIQPVGVNWDRLEIHGPLQCAAKTASKADRREAASTAPAELQGVE